MKFVVSILMSLAAGFLGSFATMEAVQSEWYRTLSKPSFNPPNEVFGPVWTVLYILMGISFALVWQNKERWGKWSLPFLIQLGLNTVWSFLFFGMKRPDLAFFEILVLWGAIVATIFVHGRISKTAGWLLVPYLAWVSFASFLNYTIVQLNR